MRQLFWIVLVVALAGMIIISCSDDDTDNSVSPATGPGLLIKGIVNCNPGLSGDLRVYGLDAAIPDIDSVTVGDSLCTIYNWEHEFPIYGYLNARYSRMEDSARYRPGDSVTVEVFSSAGYGHGKVSLFDTANDTISMCSDSLPDQIAVDGTVNIAWNRLAEADWYGIACSMIPENEDYAPRMHYYWTTDTVFTVGGDATSIDSCWLSVAVSPISGPLPTEKCSSFNGTAVRGVLHSGGGFKIFGFMWVCDTSPAPAPEPPEIILPDFLDLLAGPGLVIDGR